MIPARWTHSIDPHIPQSVLFGITTSSSLHGESINENNEVGTDSLIDHPDSCYGTSREEIVRTKESIDESVHLLER